MNVTDEDSSFIKWCFCKMYCTLTAGFAGGKRKLCVDLICIYFETMLYSARYNKCI